MQLTQNAKRLRCGRTLRSESPIWQRPPVIIGHTISSAHTGGPIPCYTQENKSGALSLGVVAAEIPFRIPHICKSVAEHGELDGTFYTEFRYSPQNYPMDH